MKATKKIYTSKKILSLIISFLFIPIFLYGGETVRIMSLWDSISYSLPAVGIETVSYRKDLQDTLFNTRYRIDFVGSVVETGPFDDPENKGYSGWRDDQIATSVYSLLNTNPADIILLHIGTNDVQSSVGVISTVLDEIDRYEIDNSVYIPVVLAQIINYHNNEETNVRQMTSQFNDNLETMVQTCIANGDNIVFYVKGVLYV